MPTLLLVQSNRIIRTTNAAGLTGYGYHVLEAATVQSVRQLINGGAVPDVAVVDTHFPDGDVQEVVEMLRQIGGSRIRIIVASARPGEAVPGVDEVVPKPAGIVELLSAL